MHTSTRALKPHSWPLRTPSGPGLGEQASPDAAVSVVCSGQLQGEASRHRWPRGQRLLLEDELGREVHLGGAHHDLSSRE